MKLAVVSFLLLSLLAGLLLTEPGRVWDRDCSRWAAATDRAHPVLHGFMRLGTEAGNAGPVLTALLLPAAFGPEMARGTVRVAFAAVIGNQAVVEILKRATHRMRPDGEADPDNASFPSSHAAAATGLAWVVGSRHRRLAPWMWILAIWISASRVFLGRHFPSDVFAGALVGIWLAALALSLQDRLAGSRRVR